MTSDHLARVVPPSGAVAWERTGGRGQLLVTLSSGHPVFLVGSKRAKDGVVWWQVSAEGLGFPIRLGWLPETGADGESILEPTNPACPDASVRLEATDLPTGGLARLACFGSATLEIEGVLRCSSGIWELSVQGAPWIDSGRGCSLDDVLGVAGGPVISLMDPDQGEMDLGRHVVRGHFDDPESIHCIATSFAVSLGTNPGPGEPAATIACRQDFVATELVE